MYKSILILIISVFISGCAGTNVYKLTSASEKKEYYKGREIINYEDNEVKTTLNFECQEENNLVFFLMVDNKSDNSFIFDPADIYAEVNDDKRKSKISVINPETEIHNINKSINQTTSSKQFSDGLNCLFLTASVVSDIASIGSENPTDGSVEREIILENMEEDEETYQRTIYNLQEKKKYWEDEFLRITTLYPGDTIGGLFYLPVSMSAALINLIIPVKNSIHSYVYYQEIVN